MQLGVELVASSRRYDDAANTRAMGGYGIVNLTARVAGSPRTSRCSCAPTTCSTGDYELAADYSTGGARVFGGVRWQL